jgi:hypothetical protein
VQGEQGLTTIGMLKAQGRFLRALMLHDIKSRIGGNESGFLLAVAWPLSGPGRMLVHEEPWRYGWDAREAG